MKGHPQAIRDRAVELYQTRSDWTVEDICSAVGCSPRSLASWVRKAGVPFRPRTGPSAPERVRRRAVELYVGGMSTHKIGDALGVSHVAVSRWLRAANIEARQQARIDHGAVAALRAENRSYSEIAAMVKCSKSGVRSALDRAARLEVRRG